MKMTPEICSALITSLEGRGWKCDINTDEKLGFIMPVDDNFEWIRDYDKSTGRFVHFNGKQKVNLVSTS